MTRLKNARKNQGLRLRELAERLGKTPQTVWKQEKNGIGTIRIAEQYAAVLKCRPEELMEFSTQPK